MQLTAIQRDLLIKWSAARETLETAKETERKLRDEVHASIFHDISGTQTVPLAHGFKVKCSTTEKRTLRGDATEIGALLAAHPTLADAGVITWEPKLSYGKAKSLVDREALQALNEHIDVTLGTPSITIEAPKDNS